MYIRWSLSDSGHIGSHFFAIAVKKKKATLPVFERLVKRVVLVA